MTYGLQRWRIFFFSLFMAARSIVVTDFIRAFSGDKISDSCSSLIREIKRFVTVELETILGPDRRFFEQPFLLQTEKKQEKSY